VTKVRVRLFARIGPLEEAKDRPGAACISGCQFCGVVLSAMGGCSGLCEECYGMVTDPYTEEGQIMRDVWRSLQVARRWRKPAKCEHDKSEIKRETK
jgi:hypothetical protein